MSFLKPVSSQGIIQPLSGYKNLDCHLYKVVFSRVAQVWSPLTSLLDATMTPIQDRDGAMKTEMTERGAQIKVGEHSLQRIQGG